MDEEHGAAESATAAVDDDDEAFSKPGANWKEKGKWRRGKTNNLSKHSISHSDKNLR